MPIERLQKIIAAAGIASRRKAEQFIASGLVSVNGQVVTELGSKADPERDHIRVNGKLLHGAQKNVYLLMNKPKGYITAVTDPERRPTVMDLLRGVGVRVYPVGRLDYAHEGLVPRPQDLPGESCGHTLGRWIGQATFRCFHPIQRWQEIEDSARQDQAHSRSGQSLVRGHPDRREEPADSAHVRGRWPPCGKNQASALRAAATGRPSGKIPSFNDPGGFPPEICRENDWALVRERPGATPTPTF